MYVILYTYNLNLGNVFRALALTQDFSRAVEVQQHPYLKACRGGDRIGVSAAGYGLHFPNLIARICSPQRERGLLHTALRFSVTLLTPSGRYRWRY